MHTPASATLVGADLSRAGAVALALLGIVFAARPQSLAVDPFAVLKPDIDIGPEDRQKLDARGVVIKILPAKDHELAVLSAGALNTTSTELARKIDDIAGLKRSQLVPQIGRFSDPPSLADLQPLTLDDGDVNTIKECRPGDCGLKLSQPEIDALRRVFDRTSGSRPGDAINQEFRRIVLERVDAYLKRGLAGLPEYATGRNQVDLATAFAGLLQNSPFMQARAPQFAAYLARYPAASAPPATTSSFLYWSKETYAWKPIISVTHVTIVQPNRSDGFPELVMASREVFATRYTSGGLVLTLLLRGSDTGAPHYLVYVNRAWVDGLHAFWRPFVNHHIRSQGPRVFDATRARIEGSSDVTR